MTERNLTVANPLTPKTFAEAKQFAEMICKSDFVPAAFKGNAGAVLAAIQFGAEVGLAPLAALQNIAVINGKPSIYGDAIPAICMTHPDFISIEETFDEKTMTATCKAVRKGNAPFIGRFGRADAEAAGLWGRDMYKKYPKRMLQMRARGFALRDAFPDALKGMISREEAEDYQPLKIVTEHPIKATPAPETMGDDIPPVAELVQPPPSSPPAESPPRQEHALTAAPLPKPTMPPNPEADPDEGVTDVEWNQSVELLNTSKNYDSLQRHFRSVWKNIGKSLSGSQKEMLTAYKDELKEYFDPPPEIGG